MEQRFTDKRPCTAMPFNNNGEGSNIGIENSYSMKVINAFT